jgi:hypothetical protein
MRRWTCSFVIALAGLFFAAAPAFVQEEEIVIVKYGAVLVKSPLPGAKVYIDDAYKGAAGVVIENVVTGKRAISCRREDRTVSGTFTVKKNETLKLEARFDEGKIVDLSEAEKAGAGKKKNKEAKRTEGEKRKEQKNGDEERTASSHDVIKVSFEYSPSNDLVVNHSLNPKTIRAFSEKKSRTGTLYRNKNNVVMCQVPPCRAEWAASFISVDETGKSDAFKLTWVETIYEYVSLTGVSKRDLEWCVNAACLNFLDPDASSRAPKPEIEQYALTWTKSSLAIRRTDGVK